MGKESSKKKEGDSHSLIFKGNNRTYYTKKVVVDFQPQANKNNYVHPSMRDMIDCKKMFPTFNIDRLSYTPAFILPTQQINNLHYLDKHATKKQQYKQIDQEDIMVPKPKDKTYCNICQLNFNDYYEHITSEKHSHCLDQNKFQKRIRKLCKKFRKRQIKINQEKYPRNSQQESASQYDSKQNLAANSNKTEITV